MSAASQSLLAETRALLDTLVAFDTTSRNSNLELIAWVEAFLAARDVPSWRVTSADGAKANLVARVGPEVEGGVVLSGHTDVVPVDGQPWTSDPWVVTSRDGRLYGRGVADMKAFLALALAHVDAARAARLTRPLILAFSYDEEVGCLGAPHMIARLPEFVPQPALCVVGEPTDMRVLSGHKGIRTFIVEVIGREAHSSQIHQGVSAIAEAVRLMDFVLKMGEEAAASADPATPFTPPGATMTIGLVEGGTAVNILARRCSFIWDLRCPTAGEPDLYEAKFRTFAAEIDAAIKARAPEGGVTITRRSDTPPFAPALDSTAETFVRALTGDNAVQVASYAAEAGLFQRAGIPTVLCGPGSILQAHQPDEWIEESQIAEGAAFMRKLIGRLGS
ncbi:MAG: acetylornithine deacetylase [Alphaproteobacteria bacterium]|nr:acetylornithine deacetylase [Alphaproteobacteria bacterium]